MHDDLPTYTSLEQLVRLVERGGPVYVRWSRGPYADRLLSSGSRDELTGTELPGLSANPLWPEAWWGDRPTALWVARRLYDYSHLRRDKGPGISPWVLVGDEAGRGPDNEPLVRHIRPVAWIAGSVITDAEAEVARQQGRWGPMRRPSEFSEGTSRPPTAKGNTLSGTPPPPGTAPGPPEPGRRGNGGPAHEGP